MMDIGDIYLFNNILSESLNQFFDENSPNKIDGKTYFAFQGIETSDLEKLYQQATIKNCFPFELGALEIFVLLATVAPFYTPDIFRGAKFMQHLDENAFTVLGGKIIGDNKAFYPTGETILFLLAGHNISKRHSLEPILDPEGRLFTANLIQIAANETGTPRASGQLYPTEELLTTIKGINYRPKFSTNFPASRIKTRMEWDDLVLPYETYEDLEELQVWMKHGDKIIEHFELGKRIKPGYKTLFFGPPGTGKTLTASLIGKKFGVDVYRIDLSMVVSKWVGETEKNLKNIFDQACNKNWILFFDEADSLFGKRTGMNSSNDRYANQETSYLLQRIEDFPGLVILASNLKANIDEAFNRRFQSTIKFPMPSSEIRYILWEKAFPKDFKLEDKVDLHKIADKYELAGGAIVNIVRYCVLMAMERENHVILLEDIEHAIIREFKKEGKIVS